MGLYVRGETGDACARNLLSAIEMCEESWAGDRAFRDVLFKLDEVEEQVELMCASPGHKAALSARPPAMSGQEPRVDREERMEVQRG